MTPERFGTVVHRVVPAHLACRIGAPARAGERDAWPAVVAIALVAVWGLGFGAVPVAAQSWMARAMPANVEGGLALFVSALRGSLAAGSAAGGIVYDAEGPGGVLIVVVAAAAAVARRDRWSREQRTTNTLKLPFAAIPRPLPRRKELPCLTRL